MLLLRWLHVLAVAVWLGGMLFIAFVVVPVTRGLPDPALRGRLVREMGRRFRTVAWAAVAVLIATGLANLWAAPYLLRAGRSRGFWRFRAFVLADNHRMLNLLTRYTDVTRRKIEDALVALTFEPRSAAGGGSGRAGPS